MVWHAGSPTGIVHADLTLTRSMVKVKIKVTELLKFRKLHFCRSISSAILAWQVMTDPNSMGDSMSEPDFQIPFQESSYISSNFAECGY